MAEELIGSLVPTKIPGYNDSADIQAALKVYHYGSYTYDTSQTNKANLINPSIAYTINDLQNQINNLPVSIKASDFNSRGVILTAISNGVVHKLAVGMDNQVLTADSVLLGGIGWKDPEVRLNNSVTLTNKTLMASAVYLPSTPPYGINFSSDSVMSWDNTNKKLRIGNGTIPIEFSSSNVNNYAPTITSNNYTLILSDKDKMLELASSVASTVTVPLESSVNYPIGTQIHLLQVSVGQFTISPASGVVINSTPGLKLRTQWSSVTLIKRGANIWVAIGDLSA
jgi:hypothetical protein